MGAWDSDPFGNDTACDWKYEVEKSTGLGVIRETLNRVLAVGAGYLEAPLAEEGVAAADTVARLKGHFYVKNSYTESLDRWVATQKLEVPAELVETAMQVIDRILTEPSELLELWEESEDETFHQHLEDLKDRLR